jgi:hypothetical protein
MTRLRRLIRRRQPTEPWEPGMREWIAATLDDILRALGR